MMRVFSRATLLLQLLLPTVVSIADARLERDAMSARAYSHVEGKTGKDCAPAHKADCALCQHLTTPLTKAANPAPPVEVARCALPGVAFAVARGSTRSPRPSLPRAPPVT